MASGIARIDALPPSVGRAVSGLWRLPDMNKVSRVFVLQNRCPHVLGIEFAAETPHLAGG